MSTSWELRDYDRDFFERELNGFLPDKLFDAHAHLYKKSHWGRPTPADRGPDTLGLNEYRDQMTWIAPDREISGLFFGVAFHDRYHLSNEFVAKEIANAQNCYGEFIAPPNMDPEQLRAQVKSFGMRGIKVYHTFVTGKPSWTADISDFLPEEYVRIANEEGWAITLHMVRDRAIADRANQECIRHYCKKYPNIKMILAHAARGFNPFHTIEGIGALAGLRNVWCDSSAVTEAGAFEAIMEQLGYDRLIWGSDFPISHLRGRCVAIGDQFVWLYEDTLDWDTIAAYVRIRPLLMGLESFRAIKLAAMRLHLSDNQIEDIFYHSAVKMFAG